MNRFDVSSAAVTLRRWVAFLAGLLTWLFGPVRRAELGAGQSIALGHDANGEPVNWPSTRDASLAASALVLGASGSGKTMLVANAVSREITGSNSSEAQITADEADLAVVVIDPKSDLTEYLLSALAAEGGADALSRVHVVNPFIPGKSIPFNLNLLEHGTTPIEIRAEQLAHLISNVTASPTVEQTWPMGPQQIELGSTLLTGALGVPGGSAALALDALAMKDGFAALADATTSERAKRALRTARPQDTTIASVTGRLRLALAASEALEASLAAPATIQWRELLQPGQLTLIDLGRPPAGLRSLQAFWANLFTRLLVEHLLERPSPFDGGPHVRIVADEAALLVPVLKDVCETLLLTGRSRRVSLTMLVQGLRPITQASPSLTHSILGNCRHIYTGRLAVADATELARAQSPAAGIDESIKSVHERLAVSFASLRERFFYDLSLGGRRLFESAPIDLEAWRRAASEHAAAIERTRLRYARSPTQRRTLADFAESKPRRGRASPWG